MTFTQKEWDEERLKHEDYAIFENIRDDLLYHQDTLVRGRYSEMRMRRVLKVVNEVMTEIKAI